MTVREIPAGEWRSFLERFSREHRAWLASVDRIRPGTPRYIGAAERPLGSVTADTRARRIVGIDIQFQPDSEAAGAIRVDRPARLRVEETPHGAARALEIEDETGACTRIRFRVPAPPGLLDGVAPGEL